MNKEKWSIPWKSLILLILLIVIIYNAFKTPIPQGSSQESEIRKSEVEFLYDLTYQKDNEFVKEQSIFPKIKKMVKEAEEFIVIDMFLFNDDYDREKDFRNISGELTESLIKQKEKNPDLEVVFITDEINNFYGSYTSKYLEKLRKKDIQVVITDLEKIRDSNPLYAGIWRSAFKNLETSGKGILPNPFSPDSPKVTVASYLKILNMKANHRKVVITENEGLVSSLNVHDASSNHSNIAFALKGEILNDLLETENSIVRFSDGEPFDFKANPSKNGEIKTQIITEGKIKKELIKEIKTTEKNDEIQMVMFYLADTEIIEELVNASDRGVEIKLVLDPNKDAFGMEKSGIPNRPAASKLVEDSKGKIKVRWYNTHGEQFHSKMTNILKEKESILIGGSANLTRRNIEDYNLETNLKLIMPKDELEAIKAQDYFQRIWKNEKAEYTLDYEAYADDSLIKKAIYIIQEKTGLSSF